jgi:hypothetical protein
MRLPAIQGIIDRRILVNYRVDPEAASRVVPAPFRPKLVNGHAIAGICLIRLSQLRPMWLPFATGLGSENAAHRFAVEWDQDEQKREGVFIPRRDSSSRMNSLLGGRLVPGEHHHARFVVSESVDELRVQYTSDDRKTCVSVEARVAGEFAKDSVFGSLAEASGFFQSGAMGYSATRNPARFDGLELRCCEWSVQALTVDSAKSSFFDDPIAFPRGSAKLDCALLMRGIKHEWHTLGDLCCRTSAQA